MVDLGKRSWFKAKTKLATPLRPPWALLEPDFIQQCTRCNDCVSSCSEGIIKQGDGGFPVLDFSETECTFCQDCVTACTHGALDINQRPVIAQQPDINSSCLTYQGIYCRSCADMCQQSAIQFRYSRQVNQAATAQPEINRDLCNQCGACVAPCPADAIEFMHVKHNQEQVAYV